MPLSTTAGGLAHEKRFMEDQAHGRLLNLRRESRSIWCRMAQTFRPPALAVALAGAGRIGEPGCPIRTMGLWFLFPLPPEKRKVHAAVGAVFHKQGWAVKLSVLPCSSARRGRFLQQAVPERPGRAASPGCSGRKGGSAKMSQTRCICSGSGTRRPATKVQFGGAFRASTTWRMNYRPQPARGN